jgi:WD40 repeat protein
VVWDVDEGRLLDLPPLPAHEDLSSMCLAGPTSTTGGGDEQLVVTGSFDGSLRVADLLGGRVRQHLPGALPGGVSAVAVVQAHPGRLLCVAGAFSGAVRSFALLGGEPVAEPLPGHHRTVSGVGIATLPDGRSLVITGSADGSARSWDLADGGPGQVGLPAVRSCGGLAVLHRPGLTPVLLLADAGVVRCRDLVSGEPWGQVLTGHADRIYRVSAAVGRDGRPVVVTVSEDRDVRVSPLGDDLEPQDAGGDAWGSHVGLVRGVSLTGTSQGRLVAVTGGDDTTVRVWDAGDGVQVGEPLVGHRGLVSDVATIRRPDGAAIAVTISADGTARVWDVERGEPFGSSVIGFTGWQRQVATAVQDTGHPVVVLSGENQRIELWGIARRQQRGEAVHVHFRWLTQVAVARLATGRDVALTVNRGIDDLDQLDVWDVSTGALVADPVRGLPEVTRLAAVELPDGTLVAVLAAADGSVRTLDARTGHDLPPPTPPPTPTPGTDPVTGLAPLVLPDGSLVLAVARRDSGVQVLDLLSGRTLAEVAVPAGEMLDVDLATDGTDVVLVAVGTGMLAVRWPLTELALM